MRNPLFVRPLTADERRQLHGGLRSSSAFVVRRCQCLLASARGERVPAIAATLGCDEQTVRTALQAFTQVGLACLPPGSSRPHRTTAVFKAAQAERLCALLHQSPRSFGKPTRVWTLAVAAAVSCAQGLTPRRVSAETIRATLARLGVRWQRAKTWITSPDPAYVRKKKRATG
jgi:transposase